MEESLYGGRLLASRESFNFLLDLIGRWSADRVELLHTWAQDVFNDEQLSEKTIRTDQRSALREGALAVGCSAPGSRAMVAKSSWTITTILAAFAAKGRRAFLIAPGLVCPGAVISHEYLSGAMFDDAELFGADLYGSSLWKCSFRDADLRGVRFFSGRACRTDFSRADLSDAFLGAATWAQRADNEMGFTNLRSCFASSIFVGSNLQRAELVGAELYYASFVNADLRGALLSGADLTEADFAGARLEGAWVDGVDLSKARNLTKEQIDSARFVGEPLGVGLEEGRKRRNRSSELKFRSKRDVGRVEG